MQDLAQHDEALRTRDRGAPSASIGQVAGLLSELASARNRLKNLRSTVFFTASLVASVALFSVMAARLLILRQPYSSSFRVVLPIVIGSIFGAFAWRSRKGRPADSRDPLTLFWFLLVLYAVAVVANGLTSSEPLESLRYQLKVCGVVPSGTRKI